MSGRLYLHIGLQKTGTSYLQAILWQSTEQLAEQDVRLVPGSKRQMFWMMLDVRGRFRPEFDPPEVARALDRFAGSLRRTTAGTVLVTEESLAPAGDHQIERLLAACGDREVHVVVTLRDLARQIPSAWQEDLKAGGASTFGAYVRRLRKHEEETGHPLWRHKDLPHLLGRWSRHVPPERIHLVTVPPPGAEPGLLLRRFCAAVGIDPERLDTDIARGANEGLGAVGAETLRRVNRELPKHLRTRDVYGDVGKRYLALGILAQEPGEKIKVPHRLAEWVTGVSQRHVDYLASQPFEVVGDLTDLLPRPEAFAEQGSRPAEREVGEATARALAHVLTDEMTRRREARGHAEGPPAATSPATTSPAATSPAAGPATDPAAGRGRRGPRAWARAARRRLRRRS